MDAQSGPQLSLWRKDCQGLLGDAGRAEAYTVRFTYYKKEALFNKSGGEETGQSDTKPKLCKNV